MISISGTISHLVHSITLENWSFRHCLDVLLIHKPFDFLDLKFNFISSMMVNETPTISLM